MRILVTGGTGHIGTRLASALAARGHSVRALARSGSARRIPAGVSAVIGDALDAGSIAKSLDAGDTLVHLVGTAHPNPSKAEEFLREGLKANPRSYEILFEMGRISYENRKDSLRARNLWTAALNRWNEQEPKKEKPNLFALGQILVNLARLEEKQGNYAQAIHWLELAIAKDASPNPDTLREQIDQLKAKMQPK
jgi:NAD(P)-dependent dehydrogenase (short-subunit alcohol dehydrogenase family)